MHFLIFLDILLLLWAKRMFQVIVTASSRVRNKKDIFFTFRLLTSWKTCGLGADIRLVDAYLCVVNQQSRVLAKNSDVLNGIKKMTKKNHSLTSFGRSIPGKPKLTWSSVCIATWCTIKVLKLSLELFTKLDNFSHLLIMLLLRIHHIYELTQSFFQIVYEIILLVMPHFTLIHSCNELFVVSSWVTGSALRL